MKLFDKRAELRIHSPFLLRRRGFYQWLELRIARLLRRVKEKHHTRAGGSDNFPELLELRMAISR
jgi:hypothetical protein